MSRRAVALISVLLLAVGCAPPSDYRTLADNETVSINKRDPSTLTHDNRVFLQTMAAFPVSVNPLRVNAAPETPLIAASIYPRTFTVKPDGSVALDTTYFAEAKQIRRNDPQMLRLRINPAAVWSDGSPVTWRDVSCQADLLGGRTAVGSALPAPGFDRIQSVVRGTDDREAIVTFHTNQNYHEWQGMFASPYALLPCSVTSNPDAFDAPPGVGTLSAGPFVISKADPKSGTLELTPNPRWWGPTTHLGAIGFSISEADADPIMATYQGAARITTDDALVHYQNLEEIADVRSSTQRGWTSIVFNTNPGSRMADERLRRAIATSIDREALATNVFHALTPLPAIQDSNIFVGDLGLDDPSLQTSTSFNPVDAGEALDALGWKLDGDTRKKDGQPLTLRIVARYANDSLQQALRSQLADLGIGLELIAEADQAANGIDVDAAIDGWSQDAFPLRGAYYLRLAPSYKDLGCCGGAVDDLIEQAAVADTDEQLHDRLTKIDRLLWQQARVIPLIQIPDIVATDANLANYGAFGIADIDATAIGFVK